MVVHNLHIIGVGFAPDETEMPLVVDPYRVLPRPLPMELFQTVGRRIPQILLFLCGVQYFQFATRPPLNGVGQFP
jgi:hypothetical protein